MKVLRSVSLLALAGAALSAHADVAFSNLTPYAWSGYYRNDASATVVSSSYTTGYQFTSGLSGTLSGFQVGINDYVRTGAFTLQLYADNGSNRLGALLGTYSATSTGVYWSSTTTALATVTAFAPSVDLVAGSRYWLVAHGTQSDQLVWNAATGSDQALTYLNGNYASFGGFAQGAFSVEVFGSQGSATPGPAAALPFALMALRRRRRRA